MGKCGSHYGFQRWPGNAKGRKIAVALALILQKMNGEIENKHFEDLFAGSYLNNYLKSASVFNVKLSSVCLERKWA